MRKLFTSWMITFISFVISIVSFTCLFIKNEIAVIIALSVFCFLLLAIVVFVIFKISRYLQLTKIPFIVNANFTTYETSCDGSRINLQTYRNIQCKQLAMTSYDYGFKWSGPVYPQISSKLQEIGEITKNPPEKPDFVKLNFKHPIFYNENIIANFQADIDDSDGQSEPFIGIRVNYPTQIIHFRVTLQHKNASFNKPARILRRKIQNEVGNLNFDKIDSVQFNLDTKTYEYHLTNPKVGYFYRLEWEK